MITWFAAVVSPGCSASTMSMCGAGGVGSLPRRLLPQPFADKEIST